MDFWQVLAIAVSSAGAFASILGVFLAWITKRNNKMIRELITMSNESTARLIKESRESTEKLIKESKESTEKLIKELHQETMKVLERIATLIVNEGEKTRELIKEIMSP